MSYVDFNGSAALQAKENGETIDEEFLYKYCPNVVEGISHLIRWIKTL